MLTTILGPLIGILGSVLPRIVNIFDRKQEIQYELELAKIRKDSQDSELDMEKIKAAISEGNSLREHDSSLDGGVFFNTLRASIRPVVTYAIFGLFLAVKSAAAYVMLSSGASVPDMLQAVWDPETAGLFSTIIAFWFGTRIWEKMDKIRANDQSSRKNRTTKTG